MSLFDPTGGVDRVVRQRQAQARRSALLPAALGSVLAASAGLSHAYSTLGWLVPCTVLVCVAFAVGWLSRRLAVPTLLSPFVSLVALVVVLGWIYVGETTTYGIPTGRTARALQAALSRALDDVRVLVAPVDINPDLALLTAAGVFLVAVLVDLIVFRLRRPSLAGLPLLTLYVIPASVREDPPSAVAFAVAAAGYVALLVAEGRDRAKGWGRRLAGRDVVEAVDVSPVSRVGRRLGVAAVSLAIVVPVFVPDLGEGFIGSAGGPGLGDGPSTREVINPIVEIAPQLRSQRQSPLLLVRTTTPDYLRLTSLEIYADERWRQSSLTAPQDARVDGLDLPSAPGRDDVEVDRGVYDVEVQNLDVSWLPSPYAPSRVEVEGDWRYDEESMTVFSARQSTRQLSYTVEAEIARPTAAQLQRPVVDGLEEYKRVTGRVPPLAQQVVDELLTGLATPYEQALALQQWFRETGGFTYDLDVQPGQSASQLDRFLRLKRGYCEQFAAAYAYLLRLAGVPTRVAIGFTPGTPLGDNTYLVTNQEAHAWPEVFFAGVGWLRFEPTPRNDGVATTPPDYARPGVPGGGEATPAPSASAPAAPTASASASSGVIRDPEVDGNTPDSAGGSAGSGDTGVPWTIVAGATLGLLGAAAPAFSRQLLRRRRRALATDPVAVANAAWLDLADDAEDLQFPLRRSDSPRQAAVRLAREGELDGPAAAALSALSRAEEQARYAPVPPTAEGLAEQVRTVRRGLAGGQSRALRLRALLFPPSTLRRGLQRGRDVRRSVADRGYALTDRVGELADERLPWRSGRGRHSA